MKIKEIICKFLKDNGKYETFILNNNLLGRKNRYMLNMQAFGIEGVFYGIFSKNDNILRKWRYFVKNNLKLQKTSINIGDTIRLNGYFYDSSQNYKVINVNWDYMTVTISPSCSLRYNIPSSVISMSIINAINGETIKNHPIEYNNYYVIKNRKTYGKID